jgi:methylenetetrahydrofolate/methylenetetrahydromethanopterin dehydrogenase (NADP+)
MKPTILVQLDTDVQPSVFDGVVAIDAGVQHLFRHGGVTPDRVRDLVYGGLFTRSPDDLKNTAVFVGGSDVASGEAVFQAVRESFFGPFRLSVMLDSNGANTTAAAAVLAARKSFRGSLTGIPAAVLGATGPVGHRVARLLAREGASVAVGSRRLDRAEAVAASVRSTTGATVGGFAADSAEELAEKLQGKALVVGAGAPGITLLSRQSRMGLSSLRVLIDLNAVPPAGLEGVEPNDKGVVRDGAQCWGALGVGGMKMKIHKQAIRELFGSNDRVLDAEDVLELGKHLD